MMVDVEDQNCPCCGGLLHIIGEDRAERLDIIPAQFRVLVIRRPNTPRRAAIAEIGRISILIHHDAGKVRSAPFDFLLLVDGIE